MRCYSFVMHKLWSFAHHKTGDLINPHAVYKKSWLYHKPVKRCAKSCQSFVSSAQPSVLTLLLRTPADTNCAEGRRRKKSKLQLGARMKMMLTFVSRITPTLRLSRVGNSASFKCPTVHYSKCFKYSSSPDDLVFEAHADAVWSWRQRSTQ